MYHQPDTLEEALKLLASGPRTVAAGCTDLFPATQARGLSGAVLDITRVAGLRSISRQNGDIRIGAATTWSDILRADFPASFDLLKQAAREVGSVQIQASGTLVGNICNASPAADGVPCLLALDASVEVSSARGRRFVPLGEFITGVRTTVLGDGELATAVLIPRSALSGKSGFLKLGARKYLVISIAMVAARVVVADERISDVAVSVGSCSPVAQRMKALEAILLGCPVEVAVSKVTPELVAANLNPIDDIRADAAYRLTAATTLTRRTLGEILLDTK